MRKITFLIAFIITSVTFAQKGIGTNNPNASSVLDVTSVTKGFLKPRMTSIQRVAINSPATGLEVFDITTNTTWYFNGTIWVNTGIIGDLRLVGADNHITSDAGLSANGTSASGGSNNIFIGKNTGLNMDSSLGNASDNIFMGTDAGNATTSGFRNVFVGTRTGLFNTTGNRNTFIGFQSGRVNTTGTFNFFMGQNSGRSNTSGSGNMFLGSNSGQFVTTGSRNIVLGTNLDVPSPTGDDQMNIASIIFGTGVNNVTGSNVSSGNIGIGTNSPNERLEVNGKVRISNLTGTDVSTDLVVTADATTGELKTIPQTSFNADLRIVGTDNHITSDAGIGSNGTSASGGINNILIGKNTGASFSAPGAGANNTSDNILLGTDAGTAITTGGRNIFLGTRSGSATTTGNRNTFIGHQAGISNTTGLFNVFIGNNAGQQNTSGNSNFFLGSIAGNNNTTGNNNAFLGISAGSTNTEGENNLYIGANSGNGMTTGSNNIILGENIRATNITGDNQMNIGAIIFGTGVNEVTGTNISTGNIGIGTSSPNEKLEVNGKVRISNLTGTDATTDLVVTADATTGELKTIPQSTFDADLRIVGTDNHITSDAGIGSNGTSASGGINNILIGKNTGAGLDNTIGNASDNIFMGTDAGNATTSGFRNVFVGTRTGLFNTTGNRNTFIGFQSGRVNTTGTFNFFMGQNSGRSNTTGSGNLFLGSNTGGLVTTGSRNVILGNNLDVSSATGDEQMNIASIIFGEGVNNVTGATISSGRVGIGVLPHATDRLYVGGNLRTAGFITAEVAGSTIPDYVFEKYFEGNSKLKNSYEFKTLEEVEAFIKLNKHLPGVMGMKDLKKSETGKYMVNLSLLTNQTLEKVEELYLYTISQEKKIKSLETENKELKERLEKIENFLNINQKQ
jgi:hypothetical protein